MLAYKPESTLHLLSIHAIHLALESNYAALEEEVTYHCIQGEFMYCDLVTDGQVFVSEEDMDELLPLLDLSVFKVEGTALYVRSGEACHAVQLHVQHISSEHFEDDDEEDEEMIFLTIKQHRSILSKEDADTKIQRGLRHLRERSDSGYA